MAAKQFRVRPLALFLGVFFAVLMPCGYLTCQAERGSLNFSGISPSLMVVPLALILAITAVMALAVFRR